MVRASRQRYYVHDHRVIARDTQPDVLDRNLVNPEIMVWYDSGFYELMTESGGGSNYRRIKEESNVVNYLRKFEKPTLIAMDAESWGLLKRIKKIEDELNEKKARVSSS